MEMYTKIGKLIKEKREKKKLSQRKLAELANVSHTEISRIDGVVRFIFVDEYVYRKSSTFSGLRGLDRDLPIKTKEVVTPKVFEKFYYEAELKTFKRLFP